MQSLNRDKEEKVVKAMAIGPVHVRESLAHNHAFVQYAYSFIYNLTERCSFLHLIILLSRYCSLK